MRSYSRNRKKLRKEKRKKDLFEKGIRMTERRYRKFNDFKKEFGINSSDSECSDGKYQDPYSESPSQQECSNKKSSCKRKYQPLIFVRNKEDDGSGENSEETEKKYKMVESMRELSSEGGIMSEDEEASVVEIAHLDIIKFDTPEDFEENFGGKNWLSLYQQSELAKNNSIRQRVPLSSVTREDDDEALEKYKKEKNKLLKELTQKEQIKLLTDPNR